MVDATNRPAPAAKGTLEKTPFIHLLIYAQERRLTGTLEVGATESAAAGEVQGASVSFVDGLPAKVRTSEPVAYLGRVLLELGFIDDGQLNASLAQMAKQRTLHGSVLLRMGAITEAQLHEGLRTQLVQKLRHIVTFPAESRFAYYDAFDALSGYGGPNVVAIDPFPVVWNAVREAPPWEHVHSALSKVGTHAVRLVPAANLQRFEFLPPELDLAERLRAKAMRVQDLATAQVLRPREAQLLVYLLLVTKQVHIVQDGVTAAPPLVATPAAPPPIRPSIDSTPSPRPADSPAPSMSFAVRPAVAERTAFSPPPAEIQRRDSAPPDTLPPSVPPPPVADGRIPSPVPRRPSSRPPLPPELQRRRDEVVARAAGIDKEDFFEMLGLERTASGDQVKSAFFELAKVWHPDRLPPALADVKESCNRVFSHMSEAHTTLADEPRRLRYMRLLKEGGATPEAQATIAAVIQAATNFQKAEICFRRNDLVQAESLCRQAHDADPQQPDYLALLAWLEALRPENQDAAESMKRVKMLDRAAQMSDRCERAFFFRAMLHKRLGNTSAAMRDFRTTMELNPRNIDAAREVRLYEMRQRTSGAPARPGSSRPPKKDDAPGIFGRLFKK